MNRWTVLDSSSPIRVDGALSAGDTYIGLPLEGPPGPPGPAGPTGPAGSTPYVHTQSVAASVWTVNHNLGFFPAVSVVDNLGHEVVAQVTHITANQVQIAFNSSAVGTARFN